MPNDGTPQAGDHSLFASNRTTLKSIATEQLKLLSGDPRKFSDKDIELAMGVMARLPKNAPLPIVTNENGEVLAGAIFVLAAQKMGLKVVTVVCHAGMSDLEQKQYVIAINELLSKGEWDGFDLNNWVRELEAQVEDFSHVSIGFEAGELDRILGLTGSAGGPSPDEVPLVQKTAVTRPGMIWNAEYHRVKCGSATDPHDVVALMDGNKAAAGITDPPYGCKIDGFVAKKGRHREFAEGSGDKSRDQLNNFFRDYMAQLLASISPGGLAYNCIDWRGLPAMLEAGESTFGPMVNMCCWVKDRAGMGSLYRSRHELVLIFSVPGAKRINNVQLGKYGRNRTNVWEYPSAQSSRRGREGDLSKKHPTPKSAEMIADAILDCTNHGDRVIDLFLGSGTTLIAAERTGRICHGMELDPLFVDVAIRRWQEWTGKAAIDAETGKAFDELAAEAGAGGESDHG